MLWLTSAVFFFLSTQSSDLKLYMANELNLQYLIYTFNKHISENWKIFCFELTLNPLTSDPKILTHSFYIPSLNQFQKQDIKAKLQRKITPWYVGLGFNSLFLLWYVVSQIDVECEPVPNDFTFVNTHTHTHRRICGKFQEVHITLLMAVSSGGLELEVGRDDLAPWHFSMYIISLK